VNLRALEALEFERIRELLMERTASAVGRERAAELAPLATPETVTAVLATVAEMLSLIMEVPRWQGAGAPDVRAALEQARVAGGLLESGQLRDVARLVAIAEQVAAIFAQSRWEERFPRLREMAAPLLRAPDFPERIERTFDPGGQVRDTASGALRAVRRRLIRLRQELSERTERLGRDLGEAGASHVTLRGGRYVLSLAASARSRLPGIVHDRSATGKTVYLEPLTIVEQNNALAELEADERTEIARILAELTAWVRAHAAQLEASLQALAAFDEVQARARLALDLRAQQPTIDPAAEQLRLVQARHPLLYRAHGSAVVPLELDLGPGRRGLIVSGPNMGGKTVVLKTAGLLVLMALAGLYVPAAEGSVIPWIDDLFVDIGDEQSLESDLSTYAARLRNMRMMLAAATARSLILVDELGAGTDPDEGAALGGALLDELAQRDCHCIVTTHHGAFKSYAAESTHFVNAAVEFDAETLRPTYRLRVGLPGRSHAFELAEREGWPAAVLAAARGRLSQEGRRVEELLRQTEAMRRELATSEARLRVEQEETARARGRHAALEEALQARLAQLDSEKAVEEDRRLQEMRRMLGELRGRIEELSARAEREALRAQEVREARRWLHARERQAASWARERRVVRPPARPALGSPLARTQLRAGQPAYARSLGVDVLIATAPDGGERVWVEYAGRRIALPASDLYPALAAEAAGGDAAGAKPAIRGATEAFLAAQDAAQHDVRGEIDLRGERAEACRLQLENYIDRALLAGYPQVRIIHGKGQGILKREVERFLRAHSQVRGFREGEPAEGGWGVTIALLGEGGKRNTDPDA